MRRRTRHGLAEFLAEEQSGVVSRAQAYAAGVTRAEVRANVRAGRWQRRGSSGIVLHNGPLTDAQQLWLAVIEAGPRAFLDGESALLAAGLEHYRADSIRVSVPRGARVRRAPGVNIRQTRRWAPDDAMTSGMPRSRPDVAAVRAALWAATDKQAALLLSMTVQQGIANAEAISQEMLRVKRDRRRRFIHGVLIDLLGGVRSLGELEFARECRVRGLPEPSRQVVRRTRSGRSYVDVFWEDWNVIVEIDGVHHSWAGELVGDALRHNDLALQRAVVLRLPLLGLRVAPDEFFAQIAQALRSAGCPLS